MSNKDLTVIEPLQASSPGPRARYDVQRWKLCDIAPNRFNSALFPDSLSEDSVALIADDLAQNGQRVPVEVTPDGTIIDGERRWRGARQLGWDAIDVVVGADLDEDQILDRVVDCCTSARQMTVREQANVYIAVCARLKREAGRHQGRPEKTIPKGIVFLTTTGIRDAAAKRAGFSSTTLALRAEAVFSRGSAEVQIKVRDGSLTITAAYEGLPKRAKARTAPEPNEARSATEDGEPIGVSIDAGSGSAVIPEPRAVLAAAAAPAAAAADSSASKEGGSGNVVVVHDVKPQAAINGADHLDEEHPSVADQVDAICRYIARLADRDYDDAVAWFERVVEEMRASLGARPENDDDVEQLNEFEKYFEGVQD